MSPSEGAPKAATPPLTYRTTPPNYAAGFWRAGRVLCFGYDLFLSHAREDGRGYANALWPRLEDLGLTVCFDREDFHIGERLHLAISQKVGWSRALLVLDTPAARNSPFVRQEIDAARAGDKPVLVVRMATLEETPWPPLDHDVLIYAPQVPSRFRYGRPSEQAINSIDGSVAARRVRLKFRRLMMWIGALVLALSAGVAMHETFSWKVESLYADAHDPRISIAGLDSSVQAFTSSWILGSYGRWLRSDEIERLKADVSRIWLKRGEWHAAQSLRRTAPTQRWLRPLGHAADAAFIADRAAFLAVDSGVLALHEPGGSVNCRTDQMEGAVTAVAATSDATLMAATTAGGIWIWSGGNCQSAPMKAAGVAAPLPAPIRLAFGNHGRSLLAAFPDYLLVLQCETGEGCKAGVRRAVKDIPLAAISPEATFCEAAIGTANDLVAVSVARCDRDPRRDICVLSAPMRYSRSSALKALAFDPSGTLLVAVDPVLATWDVSALRSAGTAPLVDSGREWGPGVERKSVGAVDRLAFNPQGTRIAVVTTVEKEKVLSIYRLQGGLSLLQSERLDRAPEFLLVGDRLIVGDRFRADVFDYRK